MDFLEMQVLEYTMTVQWNVESMHRERRAAMLYRQEKQGKIAITQPMLCGKHFTVLIELSSAYSSKR
jgi:hypothetical protein